MRERRAVYFRLFTTSGATGCCWLCCCLSGVTLARGVGLRWRHFLLGRRSHRPDLHNPIDLCQVRCPKAWGMYSLKPVRRGGMMHSGATLCPQLRARKVVFLSHF